MSRVLAHDGRTLTECESVIGAAVARVQESVEEFGAAMKEIRDGRLYKESGHSNFETYCRERWGLGRNYINKQIKAAAVLIELGTRVPSLPEKQIRPLTTLPPEDVPAVVRTAERKRTQRESH